MSLPTVLHVTHPKAGSQWVYGVLAQLQPDRIVKPKPRSAHALEDPIVRGRIYPTVYAQKHVVDDLDLAVPYRIFVVIRDLRDALVSFYFSLRYSHPVTGPQITVLRKELGVRDLEAGLAFLLERDAFRSMARIQLSWLDADAPVFRYEDLLDDGPRQFARILDHCAIPATARELKRVLADCSFERTAGRPRGVEDRLSHRRKAVAGDWKNYFNAGLKEAFKRRFGEHLVRTGYEDDERW